MYQAFYTGALGAGSEMARMSVIANNLSNINNNGFKPKTAVFSDLLNYNLNDSEGAVTELMAGNGIRMQRTYSNFSTDMLARTDAPLDFALVDNNTFFMVEDPATGEITFTRNGHFRKAELEEGFFLTTDGGKIVLDQNGERLEADLPNLERIVAAVTGEEYEEEEEDEDDDEDGEDNSPRIGVYTFSNPSRLTSVGDNEFAPPEGMEPVLAENANVQNGALERSGTDLAKEMVKMIECQRAYSYALKMVTTSDEIVSTINSLR